MVDRRRFAPATERNREPILEVLARFFPKEARVLEIASGSGEHAIFLSDKLEVASWQPSDADEGARASIDAWALEAQATRVLPAIDLDVTRTPWPAVEANAIVCINMIHISPWSACEGLMRGAREVLAPGGVLYLYGPYKRDGVHTSRSNEEFDRSLRGADPEWGVRDLEAVVNEARSRDLRLEEVIPMPANNLSVVLTRA
jgi:SAM-dependent methyltransferase